MREIKFRARLESGHKGDQIMPEEILLGLKNKLREALAKAYCTNLNRGKTLDADLIEAMIPEIILVITEEFSKEEILLNWKGITNYLNLRRIPPVNICERTIKYWHKRVPLPLAKGSIRISVSKLEGYLEGR